MSRFVLDCSVAMAWCFEDEWDIYAEGVLESLKDSAALAPMLLALETANVLLMAERRRRITAAESDRFLAILRRLPIEFVEVPLDEVAARLVPLGRSCGLTAYDASYVGLALHHGLPLASRDARLLRAAKESGVRAFDPKEKCAIRDT